jgi:hypothetical protein
MVRNDVVEAVPYMSLAECYLLEKIVELVPPRSVKDAPEGGWSMTSPVEELEIPTEVVESPTSDTEVRRSGGSTTSDTDADPVVVPLGAGSANQSVTAQHWPNVLNVEPMDLLLAQTAEEFAFLESEARFGTATQACLPSESVSGSEFFVAHRTRERLVVSARASLTELEVQAKSKVI